MLGKWLQGIGIATTSSGVVAFWIVNEVANFGAITSSHRKQGNEDHTKTLAFIKWKNRAHHY
jgi:hypothetical protein